MSSAFSNQLLTPMPSIYNYDQNAAAMADILRRIFLRFCR